MSELDKYADVLSPGVRSVWPILANAVKGMRGALFGGTALAVHLRHRQSFDLDYMTYKSFSGERLLKRLQETADTVVPQRASKDQMNADVNGVAVDVFMYPYRGDNPGYIQQLEKPTKIATMPVASLPDLLASKLDVIMYRPKLRDYIDIAAIDRSERLRIEDGLELHMRRYGTTLHSRTLEHIVDLLEQPGDLAADRTFEHQGHQALSYLSGRVPDLRVHLMNAHMGIDAVKTAPRGRSRDDPSNGARALLRPRVVEHLTAHPSASYSEIAETSGASPSYVARIARDEGLTRRRGQRT